MPTYTTKEIRELRELSGAGLLRCKHALEEAHGNVEAAAAALRREGLVRAEKLAQRETRQGQIGSYLHHNGRLAAIVEVNCETDFVARTEVFQTLVRQLAEHVAAVAPLAVDERTLAAGLLERKRSEFEDEARGSGKPANLIERIVQGRLDRWLADSVLLKQRWVREPDRTIEELIGEASAKLGEHLQVRRFARLNLESEASQAGEPAPAPATPDHALETEHGD
jgi:elongation factor Ts